jgi:hypothetical protein
MILLLDTAVLALMIVMKLGYGPAWVLKPVAETWPTLQAVMMLALWFTFKMRFYSKSSINNAITIAGVRDNKRSKLFREIGTWQNRLVMACALAMKFYWIGIAYFVLLIALVFARREAVRFLQKARLDFDRRSAVIDV